MLAHTFDFQAPGLCTDNVLQSPENTRNYCIFFRLDSSLPWLMGKLKALWRRRVNAIMQGRFRLIYHDICFLRSLSPIAVRRRLVLDNIKSVDGVTFKGMSYTHSQNLWIGKRSAILKNYLRVYTVLPGHGGGVGTCVSVSQVVCTRTTSKELSHCLGTKQPLEERYRRTSAISLFQSSLLLQSLRCGSHTNTSLEID